MDIRDKSFPGRQIGQMRQLKDWRGLDKGGDQVRAKGKRWGQLVAAIKGLQKDGGVSHIVPKVEQT